MNPLVSEVLHGLGQRGKVQLDHFSLVFLQAAALFVLWPKGGVDELLASQHSPYALAGVVMAMGLAMAYIALRAGAERILLPGQHGLRDWALAAPLGLTRVIAGYLTGHLVHGCYLLVLSLPVVLMAFTVSGGEWSALGWCVAAAFIQALFYRLCGAVTHLTIGQHADASLFTSRTILVALYVPIGWLVPAVSHVALTYALLVETAASQPPYTADPAFFVMLYAGLSVLALATVVCLLVRDRRRMAEPPDAADLRKAVS